MVHKRNQQQQAVLYYIHNDHLGTPNKITDAAQSIVWSMTQTPFGEVTIDVNAINMPMRFPGQYADRESGLSYNYSRDYDPRLGRYVQSDPIGLNGGINTYSYVYQNSVMYYDRNGKVPLPVVTGIVGGIAGGLGNVIGQVISNRGFNCFNWKNVAVATGTGFVAGAAAPFVAVSYLGAIALGGTANVIQYGVTQVVNGQEITATATGAVLSAATGVVGGVIAGPIAKNSLPFNPNSRFFPPGRAQQLNNQAATAANTRNSNLLRNAGAGAVSNTNPTDRGCGCSKE